MATATIPAVPSVAALVPAGLELASLAPAGESAAVRAAVERSMAAAVARSLSVYVVPAGVAPSAPSSSPVWAVPSATVSGRAHLVWVGESGRLCCSCPARLNAQVLSCSHTAAVRLVLLANAGRLVGASAPASARAETAETAKAITGSPDPDRPCVVPLCNFCGHENIRACSVGMCPYRRSGTIPAAPEPETAPEPDPDPEPSTTPLAAAPAHAPRATCPGCGLPTDPRELEELGECLTCVADHAGIELVRCACGALASGETADGPICEPCARERAARRRTLAETMKAAAEEGAAAARANAKRRKEERDREPDNAKHRQSSPPARENDLGTAHGYLYRTSPRGDVTRAPVETPNNRRFFCTWAAWLAAGHGAAGASIDAQGNIVNTTDAITA